MSLIARSRLEAEDYLRWHPSARDLFRHRALHKARARQSTDISATLRSVEDLCAATRFALTDKEMLQTEEMIQECIRTLDLSKVDWREFVPEIEKRRIEKAVVLKPRVGLREKGVVFVSFEDQWVRLLWNCNLKEFADNYTLVVSPTWSPPHSLVN